MRATVEAAWRNYSDDLEGVYTCPYQDTKGLITTACGVLIDPIHLALPLPWMIDGRRATEDEVRAEWQKLKEDPGASNQLASKQAKLTRIRLTTEDVDALVTKRLHANVAYFRKKLFPDWDSICADAQTGLLSLAWACGAGFDIKRPALVAAVNRKDWMAVKAHSRISEVNNAGIPARNRKQEICFDNALTVTERGLDPEWLWWPRICPPDETLREAAIKALGMIK